MSIYFYLCVENRLSLRKHSIGELWCEVIPTLQRVCDTVGDQALRSSGWTPVLQLRASAF